MNPKKIYKLLLGAFIKKGKKTYITKLHYNFLIQIKKNKSMKSLFTYMNKITPTVDLKDTKMGGTSYQLPKLLDSRKALRKAIRWYAAACNQNPSKTLEKRFFSEYKKVETNRAVLHEKKEEIYKNEHLNKPFLFSKRR